MLEAGLYNMDCLEGMREFPDGYFDLAIVDPPYGDGKNAAGGGTLEAVRRMVQPVHDGPARTGGTWAGKYGKKIIAWDQAPGKEYFDELFRVSRDQIIWGGNYFELPSTRCFLVWDKQNVSESFSMAMCEYAWTSFSGNAKMWRGTPQGTKWEKRIHPTQKPVKLYMWQLALYAKAGMRILDTHAGSGSLEVACIRQGLECWGFEIDKGYFEMARRRIEEEAAQVSLFEEAEGFEGSLLEMPGAESGLSRDV